VLTINNARLKIRVIRPLSDTAFAPYQGKLYRYISETMLIAYIVARLPWFLTTVQSHRARIVSPP